MKISDLKTYKVLPNPAVIQTEAKKSTSTGQKILDAGTTVSNFFGGKGVADTFGSEIAKIGKSKQEKDFISSSQPTVKQTVGSGIQLGANFLPGAGVGAKLATKAAVGAGTGLAFDVGSKLQKGETPTPGIGTAVGGALPVAGAAIGLGTKIVGRLLKGLGSGLSGVSTKTIDSIVENPKVAQKATDILTKNGNSKVLEQNSKQIVNGISTIRQQARKFFGSGLESLSEKDITPKVFKENTQKVLDKYGSVLEDGKRVLTGVEFNDPKNMAKASELVDKLSKSKLDGKSLRKLSDDIENAAYKTATSDERLSFNAFIKDLSSTLKGAISSSTSKLDDINQAFTQDMQLVEAVEDIFGKVNYKNLPEVVKASQKLESLFAQKGLAPDVVDDFLKRLGVNSADFRTGEAIRQISNKTGQANTKGATVGEITQAITSSVITPQLVRDISIKTGIADKALSPFLNSLKALPPILQKALIQALIQSQE